MKFFLSAYTEFTKGDTMSDVLPIAPALDMNIAQDVHVRAAHSILSQLDKVCAEVQEHYKWMDGPNVPGYTESGNIETLLFQACDAATQWLGQATFRAASDGAITAPPKLGDSDVHGS
jgi:hypothetical protein